MSKYSKLISFVMFCILTLSGFVFYQYRSDSNIPFVEFFTEEGDQSELDVIHLEGYMFNVIGEPSTNYELREGKISILNDRASFSEVDYDFDPTLNSYIRNYRSFMRGKARFATNFVETNESIIYTGMAHDVHWASSYDNTLNISLFDKTSKEEIKYDVVLEGSSSHTLVTSYYNESGLTIITQAVSAEETADWFIFSFDFDNPEETLTPVIKSANTFDTDEIQIATSSTRNERYIPFQTLKPEKTDEYGYVEEYSPASMYLYDTQTKEISMIPQYEDGETVVLSEDERVIIGNDNIDSIDWYEWDPENESQTAIGTTEMYTQTIGRVPFTYYNLFFNQSIQIANGKIYAYEENSIKGASRPMFQVIDSDSMTTTFSGFLGIETDHSNQIDQSIELIVHDLTLYLPG